MKQRNPWLVLFLSIISLGIYPIYLIFSLIKEQPDSKKIINLPILFLITTILMIGIFFLGLFYPLILPLFFIIYLLFIFTLSGYIGNIFTKFYIYRNLKPVPDKNKYILICVILLLINLKISFILPFFIAIINNLFGVVEAGLINVIMSNLMGIIVSFIINFIINMSYFYFLQKDINKIISFK